MWFYPLLKVVRKKKIFHRVGEKNLLLKVRGAEWWQAWVHPLQLCLHSVGGFRKAKVWVLTPPLDKNATFFFPKQKRVPPTRDSSWAGPSYLHHSCSVSAPIASSKQKPWRDLISTSFSKLLFQKVKPNICFLHLAHSRGAAATCWKNQGEVGASGSEHGQTPPFMLQSSILSQTFDYLPLFPSTARFFRCPMRSCLLNTWIRRLRLVPRETEGLAVDPRGLASG